MTARVRHVDTWVSEGIISPDQAESIREYERRVTPSRGTVIEVLGYVGSTMVVAAAFIMISDIWSDLSRLSRVSVLGISAVSLAIVGSVSAPDDRPTVARFGRSALMLFVPAIAFTVGVAVGAWVDVSTSVLIGSAVAWVAAVGMYLRWQSNLQHIALFFTTLSVVLSVLMYPFANVPDALPGAVVFGVGAGWLAIASLSWITPRHVAEVLGSLTAFAGSVVLVVGFETGARVSLVIVVVASLGAVAAGVLRSRVVLTITGVTGLVFYIPWLTTEFLGPTIGGPLTLVAMGGFLALWSIRKR